MRLALNMSWLQVRNWPFAIKVGLAPFLSMLLLIAVVEIGQFGISSQQKTLDRVVSSNLEGSIELSLIINDLYVINGQFYHLTSVIAIGDHSIDIAAEFDHVRASVDALIGRINRYTANYHNADLLPIINATRDKLEEYKLQVDLVSSFIEVDVAGAVNAISRFDDSFLALAHDLQKSLNVAIQDSRRQSLAATEQTTQISKFFAITAGIAIATALLLAFFIGRAIVISILDIAIATRRIAEGDPDVDINDLERSDELQQIVNSLHRFRHYMDDLNRVEEEKTQARRMFDKLKMAALRRMATNIDREADKVVALVSQKAGGMVLATDEVNIASQTITEQSRDAARAALDAMQTAETVASAALELSTSIDSIAHDINQSHMRTELAVSKTTEAMKMIDSLSAMAEQIGGVIKLISAIAHQTNMLALNATIEAARAGGEVGKGFAVVAHEVKLLANQTADATKEISTQVKAIQTATIDAHDSFNTIADSIRELGEISNTIAGSVDEQRASTSEIASAIHIAANKSRDVTDRMERLDQEVERTSQLADTVRNAAVELSNEVLYLGQTLAEIVRDATEDQPGTEAI